MSSRLSSDFLAKKLQQNWLSRCQDLKLTVEQDEDDDDSLTNLSWLQNINLTKLAAPDAPLSPLVRQSDGPLGNDNAILRDGLLKPPERTLRNTLELYRQHCYSYGSSVPRSCQLPRTAASASAFSMEKFHSAAMLPRYTPRQTNTWWKTKGQRNICRRRNSSNSTGSCPQNRFKAVQMGGGTYLIKAAPSTGSATASVYRGITTTTTTTTTTTSCYQLTADGRQALVSVPPSTEGVAFYNDPRGVNLVDEQHQVPMTCVLPTIDDLNTEEKQMFQTNQSLRPPYSYIALIYMSMEATKKSKITLNEIYSWVAENFAFYRKSEPTWKLALRQTLMRSVFFRRVPKRKEEPGGWGDIWRLNPEIRTQIKDAGQQVKTPQKSDIPSLPPPLQTNMVSETVKAIHLPKASPSSSSAPKTAATVAGNAREYWGNSMPRSSPSSCQIPPPLHCLPCLSMDLDLDLVPENDVSLLENTLEGCQAVLDTMNAIEAREIKPEASDLARQLGHNRDDASTFKREVESPKAEPWWPVDLSEAAPNFMGTLADASRRKEEEDEVEAVVSRRSSQSPESFPDIPMDYSTSMLPVDDDHPWVDDRLNLEELDTILGLN